MKTSEKATDQTETINQHSTIAAPTALTVGEIAARDFRKAAVFQKFGIDFCCGGGISLEEASKKAGISESELCSALRLTDLEPIAPDRDFAKWDLDKLADYIVDIHHRYVRDNAAILLDIARKVAGHHGKNHPELLEMDNRVRRSLHDLLAHMEKEEKHLFPAIRHLADLEKSHERTGKAQFQFIRYAVEKMQNEHSTCGEDLRHFRLLTNNYTLPEGACTSYKFLFDKLQEFETDLQQHIHLESNILFPRAVATLDDQK
jgi:regulator of cell morphogenesis and NO signaling